jgi:DedD protein
MQANFSDKNKSHLIKLTENKKTKARRRIIGSVFLLIIALIILVKVTSRVTPIDQVKKPVSVEIKNTSPVASKPIASQVVAASTPIIAASAPSKMISSTPVAMPIKASSPVIASTPSRSNQPVNILNTETKNTEVQALKPRIVTDTPKTTLSPEDILNGQSKASVKPRYYVQLIASSDKNKLIQMQDTFANKGIKTIIQSVDTPKGTVYRLRSGPFSNQTDAERMLKDINSSDD